MNDRNALDYVSRYGGTIETAVSPVVLVIVLAAAVGIFLLPRKHVAPLLLALSLLIPLGQGLTLGPAHLQSFRIMILIGWARILWGKFSGDREFSGFRFNRLDKIIIAWAIVATVTFTILYGAWEAFLNHLGFLYSAWGDYFMFRWLVRDRKDVDRMIKTLALVCTVLAIFMVREQLSGQNVFGYLGGVPVVTSMREGRIRSQGPFRHPILAGTFAATLVPLFVGLWLQGRRSRKLAVVGALAAMTVAVTSASSTPLMAVFAGAVAWSLWPLRRGMRALRWGIALLLLSLHLVMKGPVWSLINRVDLVGGSSGYHRFMLIDQTVRHFWDWWLVGVQDSGTWAYEMWDTSNQFVDTAVQGGLLTLVLFIAIIAYSFKLIGDARKRIESRDRKGALRVWALGCTLFANVAAFFGITYFDQTTVMWYSLLALIAAASSMKQYSFLVASIEKKPREPRLAAGQATATLEAHFAETELPRFQRHPL
jgi:hypothetical protein